MWLRPNVLRPAHGSADFRIGDWGPLIASMTLGMRRRASPCPMSPHYFRQSRASVSRVGTARGRTDPPVRAAEADDIAAIVKNAASPVRDHGDPPAPLQQSAPVGT